MRITKIVLLALLSVVIFPATRLAAEETISAETKAAVKKRISNYIQRDVALKGAFLMKDKNEGAVRELAFDHIHEGVEKTPDGKYVACVDFKQGEKILDVDFYVKAGSSGDLQVSDIVSHKIDGKKVGK